MSVLHDAGVPHARFQRLAQCVSARPDRHEPFDASKGHWPAYWRPEEGFDLKHHVRHLPPGMVSCLSGGRSTPGGLSHQLH